MAAPTAIPLKALPVQAPSLDSPQPLAMASSWLEPLPIARDDASWTYWHTQTGHRFPVSITGVISRVHKSSIALARIEACREVWEPRGNTCHAALQHFAIARWGACADPLATESKHLSWPDWQLPPDPHGPLYGAYGAWIEPLLAEPLWDHVSVIGSELMLFDLDRNVAGTIDLVLRLPDGSCALADLKTLSAKGSRYDTRPQLGAGMVMAEQHYGLEFSRGLTIWSKRANAGSKAIPPRSAVKAGRTPLRTTSSAGVPSDALQGFTTNFCAIAWVSPRISP